MSGKTNTQKDYDEGVKEGAKAVLDIITNPKRQGYRLKEIAEYCESKIKGVGRNESRRYLLESNREGFIKG